VGVVAAFAPASPPSYRSECTARLNDGESGTGKGTLARGNRIKAARILGINRKTLQEKHKRYRIS